MTMVERPPGYHDAMSYPLSKALSGRRARRFSLGAAIPEGALRYASARPPLPLDPVEKGMVLAAASGTTGWHYMIPFNPTYAPFLPNYSGTAWGRTFPSSAGFHTSELFFTDDEGVYHLPSRDGPRPAAGPEEPAGPPENMLARSVKLRDGRLQLPPRDPHLEAHNRWCVNRPGSLLIIPVADIAQHMLLGLCYLLQNRAALYDDLNRTPIPGLDRYSDLFDAQNIYPLSFMELLSCTEASVEISASCYAGMLQLQAMGLGGWMFDGINPFSVLGATGDPDVPGLGFRYDTDERWALPNPTGLEGHFEGFCPPHCKDMREAVDRVVERKFGPGGPFHRDTPGPWKESREVRGGAQTHSEEFRECVALQAQYVLDTFGKFPGTVPTIWVQMYLQAHHLDLGFYDEKFGPGAYLETHAEHMKKWHPGLEERGSE
ncbi:MAG: hypothetical protein ISF22_00415 [Methanomassiliicoccus sp.]|nr:hypothetical protein [Methanomassiliicoccus sp.]